MAGVPERRGNGVRGATVVRNWALREWDCAVEVPFSPQRTQKAQRITERRFGRFSDEARETSTYGYFFLAFGGVKSPNSTAASTPTKP
jgi:hypothetical protein